MASEDMEWNTSNLQCNISLFINHSLFIFSAAADTFHPTILYYRQPTAAAVISSLLFLLNASDTFFGGMVKFLNFSISKLLVINCRLAVIIKPFWGVLTRELELSFGFNPPSWTASQVRLPLSGRA